MQRCYLSLLLVSFCLILVDAEAAPITSAYTGAWYDPAFDKQGFSIEVLDRTDGSKGKRLLAFWYSYDDDGNPIWATGEANIEAEKVTVMMSKGEGGSPTAPASQAPADLQHWAEVDVQFSNCNTGTIGFASDKIVAGTGTFNIKRLSSISARSCSGGISDDVDPEDSPESDRNVLKPGPNFPSASGRLDFEQNPGRVELEVEVDDLPVADYPLFFNGSKLGTISVVSRNSGGTQGKLRFRSPADSDSILLDFDPRAGDFEVRDDQGSTVLFGSLGSEDDGPDSGMTPPPGGTVPPGLPPFGDSEFELEFDNQGVLPDARGDAELKQRPDRLEFNVEIDKVPTGDYSLRVGGAIVGTLTVNDFGGGNNQGKLEFRFPAQSGKPVLTFDPRDVPIEILQSGSVILTGMLEASGGGEGGD